MQIFTDASFDPRTQMGVCGYLVLDETPLILRQQDIARLPVTTCCFRNTTCTRLELTAVVLALDAVNSQLSEPAQITVYTDCKTARDLPSRRDRLEKCNFISKRSGKPLANADLYRKLFELFDALHPNIRWVKGHQPTKKRTQLENIFAHVDKTTRKFLSIY